MVYEGAIVDVIMFSDKGVARMVSKVTAGVLVGILLVTRDEESG